MRGEANRRGGEGGEGRGKEEEQEGIVRCMIMRL
jgi:hypothetical protein